MLRAYLTVLLALVSTGAIIVGAALRIDLMFITGIVGLIVAVGLSYEGERGQS